MRRFAHILIACLAFLATHCSTAVEEPISSLSFETKEVAYTGNIRISLTHPYDINKDDFEILLAADKNTKKLGVCESDKVKECKPGLDYYFEAPLMYETAQRRFYKTKASALLENDLVLTVVGLNASGEIIDTRNIKFVDSGGSNSVVNNSTTPPDNSGGASTDGDQGGSTAGQGGPPTSDQIKPIVQTNCGGGGCHPTYASTPEILKQTNSAALVQSGNMPKGRAMSANDKDLLLKYLAAP